MMRRLVFAALTALASAAIAPRPDAGQASPAPTPDERRRAAKRARRNRVKPIKTKAWRP